MGPIRAKSVPKAQRHHHWRRNGILRLKEKYYGTFRGCGSVWMLKLPHTGRQNKQNNPIRSCERAYNNHRATKLPSPIPDSPWQSLSVDFGSRSPTNEYTLAIYEDHSRKTLVKLAANLISATAIAICKNFFAQYGVPKIPSNQTTARHSFQQNVLTKWRWTHFQRLLEYIFNRILQAANSHLKS